jgi:hypothetical protein
MHTLRRSEAAVGDLGRLAKTLQGFWAHVYPCEWESTLDILYFAADPNAVRLLQFLAPLHRFVPDTFVSQSTRRMESSSDLPSEEFVWEEGVALFGEICQKVVAHTFNNKTEFERFVENEWPFLDGWAHAIKGGVERPLIARVGILVRAWARLRRWTGPFAFGDIRKTLQDYFHGRVRALGLPEEATAQLIAEYLSQIDSALLGRFP